MSSGEQGMGGLLSSSVFRRDAALTETEAEVCKSRELRKAHRNMHS